MFLTTRTRKFLHHIIRGSHCFALMNAIINRDSRTLAHFTAQAQGFLERSTDELFPRYDEKYLTFMDYMRERLDEGKDDAYISTNEYVFKLYHIPKKRNNLLLFFLFAHYAEHPDLRCTPIFQTIYLYLSIVSYRNRATEDERALVRLVPAKEFRAPLAILRERYSGPLRRFARYARPVGIATAGVVAGFLAFALDRTLVGGLAGDAAANGFSLSDPRVVMQTFFAGSIDSGVLSKGVETLTFQNIATLLALVFLLQAIRSNVQTMLVNSTIQNLLLAIIRTVKWFANLLLAAYDYVIYRLATRYVSWSLYRCVRSGVAVTSGVAVAFLAGYVSIYLVIIGLYVAGADYLFAAQLPWTLLAAVTIALASLTLLVNFIADVKNFEEFVLEVNTVYDRFSKFRKDADVTPSERPAG